MVDSPEEEKLFDWVFSRYLVAADMASSRDEETRKMRRIYASKAWRALDGDNAVENAGTRLVECNLIAPTLNAILGAQLQSNRTTAFIAKNDDSNTAADILNQAYEWFKDASNMGREISAAFRDCAVSGTGCVEIGLDFSEEATGKPKASRIDPLEMAWDPRAQKVNVKDARYAFRITEQTVGSLKKMFPDADETLFGFDDELATQKNRTSSLVNQARGIWPRAGDQPMDASDRGDDRVAYLCEARWIEQGPVYWLDAGTWQTLEDENYEQARREGLIQGKWIKRRRNITKRAYLGNHGFLQPVDEPLCKPGTLGWEFLTAYYDSDITQYYGVIANAVDLQMSINKYLTIMNTSAMVGAKSGLIVEEGAVGDIQKFESKWAESGSIITVPQGTIENNRIMPKPLPATADTIKDNLQMSLDLLPQVLGVSKEFLGLTQNEQANVLEQTRRKSTLNILAELFDNLRQARIAIAEQAAYIIQNFVPDGTLIRTVEDTQTKFVKFAREAIQNISFQVEVDEVDNSLTDKQTVWQNATQITQMLVQYAQSGAPMDLAKELLSYAPLPSALSNKMVKIIGDWENQQQQAQQQQAQQEAQEKQQEAQMKQGDINAKLQAEQGKTEASKYDSSVKAAAEVRKAEISAMHPAIPAQGTQNGR